MIVDYENQKKVGDCISFKVLKNEILEAFPKINSLEDFFSNKTYRESKKGKEKAQQGTASVLSKNPNEKEGEDCCCNDDKP